jgi:hypothetical protein
MTLTPGENLILKMLVSMRTDFAAFSDLVIANLFTDKMGNEKDIAEFGTETDKLRIEKQNEIIAQLKNLYSDKIGNVDDMINDILKD